MGRFGRPHGVRGLVHVVSFTAEPADLPRYGPFDDGLGRRFSLAWRGPGIAEVTEIVEGRRLPVSDRNAAATLNHVRLYVDRDRLPPAAEGEFYLIDLIGLQAFDAAGTPLGRVKAVRDVGAGASLFIGKQLVPFTRAAVPAVDLAAGRVTVAPPTEVLVPPRPKKAP
jgi:16S rRNA processing protein RimM